MKIVLRVNTKENKFQEFESKIDFDLTHNLVINITEEELHEGKINDIKDEILSQIEFNNEILEFEDNEDIIKALKKQNIILEELYNKPDTFYDNLLNISDVITFNAESEEEFNEIMRKNPNLNNKNIIYPVILELNEESLKIAEDYNRLYPNIKFIISGNINEVTHDEIKSAHQVIKNMIDEVNLFDYSPIEKILHAYDLVRNRKYKKSDNDELNPFESRELTKVLTTDNIVCVGYANIFTYMLENLGINSVPYSFKGINKSGHARVLAYIKDDKYKIEGIYAFDPTWDSKKDDINSVLNSYLFFAKPVQFIRDYDSRTKQNIYDDDIPSYNNNFTNIPRLFDQNSFSDKEKRNYTLTYLHLHRLVFNNEDTPYKMKLISNLGCEYNEKDIKDFVYYLESLRNNHIDSYNFLDMLIKVRKNENSIHKEIPVIDRKNATEILKRSYFAFPLSKSELLLAKIFGEEISDDMVVNNAINKYENSRKSLGKRLVKSLNQYKENK